MDTSKRIEEIEAELSVLPHWSIIKRNVNGKDYYYTRIKEDGKNKDIYLGPDVDEQELALVARRKELEKELKRLKIEQIKSKSMNPGEAFRTDVLYGRQLRDVVDECAGLKRRDCFDSIRQYIYGTSRGKVFILYGLRRTGKTTLMCQVIADMDEADYDRTALIRVTSGDALKDVDRDMRSLKLAGFRYVFIDEVTFLDEFIRCAELFSDIFAASGMKIVLTGTDSLGFKIASEERLFDRCFMLHTTFIPYREFEEVLGVRGIDEYISRGGTMSVSGENYNDVYGNKLEAESTKTYVNTSIAVNIQNSLKNYEYGGRFRNLMDLYKSGELTSAINKIVENINHEFAVEVLMSDFDSEDFDQLNDNLKTDPLYSTDILDLIDKDTFNEMLRRRLSILNASELTVQVTEEHVREIKEYLSLLDLIYDIDLVDYGRSGPGEKMTVMSQPGLRCAQADAFVGSLKEDDVIKSLNISYRNMILDRARNIVHGGIMEEIVQLETKLAKRDKEVFKLRFDTGEIDMVVADEKAEACELYEIKYSTRRNDAQRKNLQNKDRCDKIEFSYGTIIGKYVIYRGETAEEKGVTYLNVEDYLKSL